MAWNQQESRRRVCEHLGEITDIEVAPLVREADLDELLTERVCRQIYGVHLYAHPSEFSGLADLSIKSDLEIEKYRQVVRAVHIYQREISHIVETIFDAVRVHFQGVRLHSLIYRPIRDEKSIARRAFLHMLVLDDFVRHVYNPAFESLPNVKLMAGASQGEVIGTRNGGTHKSAKNDRELLFLGSPANHAAKILSPGLLRITETIHQHLTPEMKAVCVADGIGVYRVSEFAASYLTKWLRDENIDWSRTESARRVEVDKKRWPLADIKYSEAQTKIDFDSLGITNNKRVRTVTLYGDVTGFTAYIDSMRTQADRQEAIRLFHVIRREMARIVRDDYEGVRVQFQGDRVQAIFHVPADDFGTFVLESVMCAGALQASLETVIKSLFPSASSLNLAVGCDLGQITASNLGTRGHRDRICLGRSVEAAAAREELLDGGQTGISTEMYELLPVALKRIFNFDDTKRCYVARNHTVGELKRLIEAEQWKVGNQAIITSGANGIGVKPVGATAAAAVAGAGRVAVASSSYAPSAIDSKEESR
ncbi:MAG TPA: adenylate/guanylate cyclase domain-containing protein [Abditibacterium sp.]|jgi:hypothetical protein